MKRLYATAALCALLIIMGFVSLFYVYTARNEIVAQIDFTHNISQNGSGYLIEELERLEKIWVSHRDILYHHAHHEKLDEISRELIRAKSLAKEGEYAYMREALSAMRWLVESVWENESAHADNIF